MYSGTTDAFQARMKPFTQTAPLAVVREGIDSEAAIKGAPAAGGRAGYSHEIAGLVVLLCLPEASWTTGSVVCANGGMKFCV
jgi:NAD(P)-dependent dehydrogenase (short-subunit alcohol dehydrogenase family)